MLQQKEARDSVIATAHQTSVRAFLVRSAHEMDISLRFEDEGTDEKGIEDAVDTSRAHAGIIVKPGDTILAIDTR